ncbi:acyl-ACP--UDP-N-acetylglucosamine O-acyltransferase [Synechococcus sp. PCC 6312]|uniref:acyl-ACP--UDP-N-acetylglucosamine O-acyltransferase n=1 Tax=Synechococcus sp. (strain ATCC 27167 / PCC 6312) TaxID=195253 RepID=UPI00029F3341|nr:acyl-ACP--UDP-N-acetylglucosamine O-acyltransferase [Synechococcus sp. PCC 6312]AFY59606.1 acyl-(acyl-carrier-protein)--UDP-N-acetylglucosamine O-acyltransferase [Synechococcus sp. PCC 6312]
MQTLIHPTAVIHPDAEVDPTVQVGPYAVIGAGVKVGADTQIGAHVVLAGRTEIGQRNQIFPGAVIGTISQDQKYAGADSGVRIGDDNCIREYVTINCANGPGEVTQIGNGNWLLAYVHIAHDCVIEDQVVITNASSIAGHVWIESKARIGGMVGIHQFVRIGRLAMIGAMARVDRDVPPFMLVEGHPARIRALNQVGLRRSGLDDREMSILKQAFRRIYRDDLPLEKALNSLETLEPCESLGHLNRFLNQAQTPGRRGLTPGNKNTPSESREST